MKTRFMTLGTLVLSLVAFSSCNKADVEVVEPQGQEVKFKVFSEETKTYLNSGVTNWSSGDIIYVLDPEGKWYNSSKLESGTVVEAEFTFSTFPEYPTYALFVGNNNSGSLGIEDDKVTANLFSEQSISNNNSFGKSANITIGEVVKVDETTYGASLKNVCGLLKFEVPAGIASVEISGNDNEDLAGVIYIDYNSGEPTWTAKEGVKEITITPRKSGENYVAGTYYACVLPQTFEKGITVTLTDINGYTAQTKGSNPLALGRNAVVNLPNLNIPEAPEAPKTVVEFDFTDLNVYPENFPITTGNSAAYPDGVAFKATDGNSYTFKFEGKACIYKTDDVGLCIYERRKHVTLPVISGKTISSVKILCGNAPANAKTVRAYNSDGEYTDYVTVNPEGNTEGVEISGSDLVSLYTNAGTTIIDKLILTYE